MKTKELSKRYSGAGSEPSRVPKKFPCVDPTRKRVVLDFLMDYRQDLKDSAIMHLRLCLHCREIALASLRINRHLEQKSGDSVQAEGSERVEGDHTVSEDVTENRAAEFGAEARKEDQETDLSTSNSSI